MLRLVSTPLISKLVIVVSLLMCALSGPATGAWVLCVGDGSHVAIEAVGDSAAQATVTEIATTLTNETHCRDIPLLKSSSSPVKPFALERLLDCSLVIAVLWSAVPERLAGPITKYTRGDDPLGLRLADHRAVVLLI